MGTGPLSFSPESSSNASNPAFILEQAARSAHYSKPELATLSFAGRMPDIQELGRTWRMMMLEAEDIAAVLPEDRVGTCVLRNGELFKGSCDALQLAVANDTLVFHEGSIRGAWPRLIHD